MRCKIRKKVAVFREMSSLQPSISVNLISTQPPPSFRNRVAVHLQKNLDRQRLKRIAHKLSSTAAPEVVAAAERKGSTQGSRTGGLLGSLPGQLPASIPRQKSPGEIEAEATGNGADDDEYEYYDEEEEEASGDK